MENLAHGRCFMTASFIVTPALTDPILEGLCSNAYCLNYICAFTYIMGKLINISRFVREKRPTIKHFLHSSPYALANIY